MEKQRRNREERKRMWREGEIGRAQPKENPSGGNNLVKYCRKTQRQRNKKMKEKRRRGERITDPNPRQPGTRQKYMGNREEKRKVSNRFPEIDV